jgi:peptide/nickel transport system permease protein
MISYIGRRILLTIPAMIAMSVIVFFIIRIVPGDPVLVILGLRANPESIATLRAQLHLDDPLWVQYVDWFGNVLRGDLGYDYRTGESITHMLTTRLPVTLEVAILAMVFAAVVGVPLGVLSASRRGVAEFTSSTFNILGISIPDFWLGVMLILLFSANLRWLPSSGYVPMSESVTDNLRHMILPAVTLGVSFAAVLTRTTHAAVADALRRPYVQTARAKGLKEQSVVLGHVLKNAAIPIITVMGLQFGYALGGAIVIDYIFSLPGIGQLTLNAVLARNYPVIQGAVLLVTFLFMLSNIMTDSLYALLDPRIRHSGR